MGNINTKIWIKSFTTFKQMTVKLCNDHGITQCYVNTDSDLFRLTRWMVTHITLLDQRPKPHVCKFYLNLRISCMISMKSMHSIEISGFYAYRICKLKYAESVKSADCTKNERPPLAETPYISEILSEVWGDLQLFKNLQVGIAQWIPKLPEVQFPHCSLDVRLLTLLRKYYT